MSTCTWTPVQHLTPRDLGAPSWVEKTDLKITMKVLVADDSGEDPQKVSNQILNATIYTAQSLLLNYFNNPSSAPPYVQELIDRIIDLCNGDKEKAKLAIESMTPYEAETEYVVTDNGWRIWRATVNFAFPHTVELSQTLEIEQTGVILALIFIVALTACYCVAVYITDIYGKPVLDTILEPVRLLEKAPHGLEVLEYTTIAITTAILITAIAGAIALTRR